VACIVGLGCSFLFLVHLFGLTPSLIGGGPRTAAHYGRPMSVSEIELSADAAVRDDEEYELAASAALAARRAARRAEIRRQVEIEEEAERRSQLGSQARRQWEEEAQQGGGGDRGAEADPHGASVPAEARAAQGGGTEEMAPRQGAADWAKAEAEGLRAGREAGRSHVRSADGGMEAQAGEARSQPHADARRLGAPTQAGHEPDAEVEEGEEEGEGTPRDDAQPTEASAASGRATEPTVLPVDEAGEEEGDQREGASRDPVEGVPTSHGQGGTAATLGAEVRQHRVVLSEPDACSIGSAAESAGFADASRAAAMDGDRVLDVTLITQASADRLWMLPHICERWPGPMVVATLLSSSAAPGPVSAVPWPASLSPNGTSVPRCRASLLELRPPAEGQYKKGVYPINWLRNRAIRCSRTSHYFIADVDFWPSFELLPLLRLQLEQWGARERL